MDNPNSLYKHRVPTTGKRILPDDSVVDVVHPDGNMRVRLENRTTPPVIVPMVQLLATSSLAVDAVIDSHTLTVVSSTGFSVGDHIRVISPVADRFYFGEILAIAGNDITVDSHLDYAHLAGAAVTVSNKNVAVDGSVTPVVFKLRTGSPSIESTVDVTRIIIECKAPSAIDLNKFGSLPRLTNGIEFRKTENNRQTIRNIFNAKDNSELAELGYDFTVYEASNPSQGIDGFLFRLTFAGQSKIGTALRTHPLDNFELVVNDDLTGLTDITVVVEGHIVD